MIRKMTMTTLAAGMLWLVPAAELAAQSSVYSTSSGTTRFSSKTPMEDINAENEMTQAIFNTATGEIAIRVNMKDFSFENKLMQEHFNENYMETSKYPVATFSGKLGKSIDISRDGEYEVSASGKFTVHGVTQNRTLDGKIKIEAGKILITSAFQVALADHKIEIPKIVFVKIAQQIQVNARYTLVKK
ncbi:MAG TPA: YceI family protein [Dyadobacter sp.]|jgi:polyisoprenoid-binding protein YceI|nr:YceI family protein [Dyadobacter sp.]